ncbi:MAG: hypothetical protein IJP33_03160 [Firmicutes bacterium]|nr:hypothetical protein [Bacillota bacterium]
MSKFEIPYVPSVRYMNVAFPKEMVDEVQGKIAGKQCNFSAFVIAAVRMALDELQEGEND